MKRPMLAATATELSELRFPLACTPKLDGIRALTRDGAFYSRSAKLLPNEYCQQLARELPAGLDGELICGDFNSTQSAVMSAAGAPSLQYYVFDRVCPGPYWARIHSLPALPSWCRVLLPTVVRSVDEFLGFEADCVAVGYEGVICRDATAEYVHRRSTLREHYMVKFKRFLDAESRVVGFKEGTTNDNTLEQDAYGYAKRSGHASGKVPRGTLGSLLLADGTQVGSGLSDVQRAAVWNDRPSYLGRLVKYRYQQPPAGCAPRFPRFVAWVIE